MNVAEFGPLFDRYSALRIAVIGDFCLDRYLEIDPAKAEISIETGLPVHNVVRVRSQPGGAGTILNNLCALGIGSLYPVGFCGDDGEGFELDRALKAKPGVQTPHFFSTPERRTFTYCKPLITEPGKNPRELNRLDSKNWSPTPDSVQNRLRDSLLTLAPNVDAIILLDQVDVPSTGVITARLLDAIREVTRLHPNLTILADSRRGLKDYPPVCLKMNAAELSALTGAPPDRPIEELTRLAIALAAQHRKAVFITLSERGILAATPEGTSIHIPSHPVRGEIDVVGAGDSVSANLTAAIAAGATLEQALRIAMAAASIVVHQLGTTGTASRPQLLEKLAQTEA